MFSFIVISWFLNFGYVPQQCCAINQNVAEISTDQVNTVLELGLSAKLWDRLTISGSAENFQTFFHEDKRFGFSPYLVNYKISASFDFTKNMQFVVSHECIHPIISLSSGDMAYDYLMNDTKIYMHFQGSTSF